MIDVKNILVITLSNIGDVVLTTPVIDLLKKRYPKAHLEVMVGPKAKELFLGAPGIDVLVYDKLIPLKDKLRLVLELRKKGYDLVVDLRNTFFPFLVGARYRTPFLRKTPKGLIHMKDRHLARLRSLGIEVEDADFYIWIGQDDANYIDSLLNKFGVSKEEALVALSPGARSDLKIWDWEKFKIVSDRLMDDGKLVIMVGDEGDIPLIERISSSMKRPPITLGGQTNLRQLAALLKRCKLLITNDSAPMHIGAALGVSTLAIFGPTDPKKYGPIGELHSIVRCDLACSPCEVAHCSQNHECMKFISPDEVYQVAHRMLERPGL